MADINQHQDIFENAGLIIRHLRGELTPQEQEALNKWLTEDKRNRLFLETLSDETSFRKELDFFFIGGCFFRLAKSSTGYVSKKRS